MTELDPEIIKKTQSTLGKYVKKPALTEKLLKKPPFRFLHDIITSVIHSSGYFDGLFEPDEMVSANIKDKEGKILFLQKVIDVVKISTKENVDAKPSKIVAGHEPEKTNVLLQLIGTALSKKISSVEAVKLVRNGAVAKSNKNSSNKPSKIIKQSSIDSVKTKSKSSEDTKTTTLKDNNKIIQKVKDVNKDSKDKIIEKPSKDRKEKETKSSKISRDVKKPSKEVKSSELAKSEKLKTKNDSEVKKTFSKSIKEEPDSKIEVEPDAKVKNVPEVSQELLNDKDPMGEIITKSNNDDSLQKSFEPKIVSIQVQSGLLKSKNEQIIDHVTNGDIPEDKNEKSAMRSDRGSGKREKKLVSDEKVADEIKDKDDKVEPESITQTTSDGEDVIEQNEKAQEKEKPKSSRKKENTEISTSIDVTRTTNSMISSKNNSADNPDIPSIPRPRTSLRPPSVRPASARPGAPRRRDRNVEIILQSDGNMPKPGVNIKIDHLNTELDDDGENLVIIEDSTSQTNNNKFGIDVVNENDEEQQGHLVQQILETQKEFLKMDEEANENKRRADNEWDSTNLHQRQTSAKQMDSLRDSIQKLTRSINPLGKLMDFLQEDVDSMQMELAMWKNSYATTKMELKREEGLTESAIEPLKLQLAHLESDIKDQIEIMDLARVDITENEEKILKLLTEM